MRESIKVAVLSDIHGNALALKYAIDDLRKLGINKVIILGDVVLKGPMPTESLEILQNSGLEILAWVKGNTDLWLEEVYGNETRIDEEGQEKYLYYKYAMERLSEDQRKFLRDLPEQQVIKVNDFSILVVHGTPKSIVEAIDESVPKKDIEYAMEGVEEDVVLTGHSHTVFIGDYNGKRIFNVGSIGNPLDGDERLSYGILDFIEGELILENRRIAYPIDEVKNIVLEREFFF